MDFQGVLKVPNVPPFQGIYEKLQLDADDYYNTEVVVQVAFRYHSAAWQSERYGQLEVAKNN